MFRTAAGTQVRDDRNGKWTLAASSGVNSLWYVTNAGAGATTVVVSGTQSGPVRADVAEYTGIKLSDALAGASCNAASTGTVATTGNAANILAGRLDFIGLGMFTNPLTVTAGSSNGAPATLRNQLSGAEGTEAIEDVLPPPGNQDGSFKLSANADWVACIAAFRPRVTSTPTPTPSPTSKPTTTPTSKPTPTPSSTPTPTATPTPTPTSTPPPPPTCAQTLSPGNDITAAIQQASAGSVVCLNPGTYTNGGASIDIGSSHGVSGAPVTVTSADPSNPAVIDTSMTVFNPANWITFTHLDFHWAMPTPWGCINAQGDGVPGEIITENYPVGKCGPGTQNPADWPQIAISAAHTSFTYDDINGENSTICINIVGSNAQYNVIDHDRIYNCGPPVAGAWNPVNEDQGWHDHAVYDYGQFTTITNNYIYDNSRNGILFYPSGNGEVAEHNVIDGNGNGVTFAGDTNVTVKWNIITNSRSPLGFMDYGADSYYPGSGGVLANNCFGGNESGDISAGGVTQSNNITGVNPLYVDATTHDYKLQPNSPCLGYGPDTAQP